MRLLHILIVLLISFPINGQSPYFANLDFTKSDTLRGSLRPERTGYDVHFYHLDIQIDPSDSIIAGQVDMHFHLKHPIKRLQIDLFENMKIEEIKLDGKPCAYEREANAIFVNTPNLADKDSSHILTTRYIGQPIIAKMPPWDGGFVWSQNNSIYPWVGVACEGTGASLWWPNKDHLSDEPDSMLISVEVPKPLICVSNGTLISSESGSNTNYVRYNWKVHYPINNYNVTVNFTDYAHFQDKYQSATTGETLNLDYYVLPSNELKARKHFGQVDSVLLAFEHYFGPYPFWKDGYALVETPYLGMEHQGAIAYGNQYKSGYLGSRLPEGLDFDYIILHETGHEYFGNSVSCSDLADLWIHESFTTYMEALFVEYWYGQEKAEEYLISQRPFIVNQYPLVGPYHVNWDRKTDSDIYYKGSWMLHTLRSVVDNEELWFDYLLALYQEFALSNTWTTEIVAFTKEYFGLNAPGFFEQYLHNPDLPVFQYSWEYSEGKHLLKYRWKSDIQHFQMPLKVKIDDTTQTISPTTYWQVLPMGKELPSFELPINKYLIEMEEK